MTVQWYVLQLQAVPWRVGPVTVGRGKNKGLYGKVGRDQELHNFQEAVRDELLRQDPLMIIDGKVRLTILFWRKIEQYKTAKSRAVRNQEADATNLLKATEDALQGILFGNDKDNVDVRSIIVEQNEDAEAKIVLRVEQVNDQDWLNSIAEDMPDEIYASAFGSPEMQLQFELNKPKTTVEKEDDRYGNSDVTF